LLTIFAITLRASNNNQPNFQKAYRSEIEAHTCEICAHIQGVAGAGKLGIICQALQSRERPKKYPKLSLAWIKFKTAQF